MSSGGRHTEPGPEQTHDISSHCSALGDWRPTTTAPYAGSYGRRVTSWRCHLLPKQLMVACFTSLAQYPGNQGSEGECALNLDVPRQQEVHRDSCKMGICSALQKQNTGVSGKGPVQ